jgi:hypothetical protein
MTYPPVIQLETRAFEAELQARLSRERRAARAPKHPNGRWRLRRWLPLPSPGARVAERAPLLRSRLRDCEQ